MKNTVLLLLILTAFLTSKKSYSQDIIPQKISFPSIDGLPISANLYHNDNKLPVILLCHQARYNKAEYDEIAVTLYKKGFNLIAIDQRSGGTVNNKENETFVKAIKLGKPTDYLDAEQDIQAAIDFAYKKYNKKIILWGSSYSSALALYFAKSSDKIKAVIAFSPGDYFGEQKKSLKEELVGFSKPMFVTSSSEEAPELTSLLTKMTLNNSQLQFIPKGKGKHGSKALWKNNQDNQEYWTALNAFLDKVKN
ncbi:alpha/beta hydrolase [Flavobacterium soyangense]|uniref:Alpha/beta hydrolase n=1 Tax=Flavobacterium soyangense TaxID=2023265 RepID=A0A930UCL3_9FLAO|nr:dienelactone hydrolase family protein [Flavobacterium soyangense]MBF2709595.1 alpha/beta hydrolase [Flavobacterium soyangense]